MIVVFVDSFTSFIASFAIFSIIGYGAYILERPVESVVEAGTGLAFIVYPKVLTIIGLFCNHVIALVTCLWLLWQRVHEEFTASVFDPCPSCSLCSHCFRALNVILINCRCNSAVSITHYGLFIFLPINFSSYCSHGNCRGKMRFLCFALDASHATLLVLNSIERLCSYSLFG